MGNRIIVTDGHLNTRISPSISEFKKRDGIGYRVRFSVYSYNRATSGDKDKSITHFVTKFYDEREYAENLVNRLTTDGAIIDIDGVFESTWDPENEKESRGILAREIRVLRNIVVDKTTSSKKSKRNRDEDEDEDPFEDDTPKKKTKKVVEDEDEEEEEEEKPKKSSKKVIEEEDDEDDDDEDEPPKKAKSKKIEEKPKKKAIKQSREDNDDEPSPSKGKKSKWWEEDN